MERRSFLSSAMALLVPWRAASPELTGVDSEPGFCPACHALDEPTSVTVEISGFEIKTMSPTCWVLENGKRLT